MFLGAANAIEANKEMLNSLNVFPVPDGDTGTNMYLTMKSAVKDLDGERDMSIGEVLECVSKGSLMGARGNSGVILSQLIRGFCKGLQKAEAPGVNDLANAFKEASDMAYRAVVKPTEGTILTVARGCGEAAVNLARKEEDMAEFMKRVIEHSEEVLKKTPDMLPVLKEAGVVDAGGQGYVFMLKGMMSALSAESVDSRWMKHERPHAAFPVYESEEEIAFGYCTEFIINNATRGSDSFKNEIESYGDSLLVVEGDGVIKVHIHTNNPGKVIEKALELGELIDIKIDNMRYQHHSNGLSKSGTAEIPEESGVQIAECGIIAVSAGEGLDELFKDLGVDFVVSGGQTMNPSTEDIVKAVESVNAHSIIVLPNNSNIIMAAIQAKELTDKEVEVIPTKSIQDGIAAMVAFDPEVDFNANIVDMIGAYSKIKTGQITLSVKDTTVGGRTISKGDVIGISGKEIVCTGIDVNETTRGLVDALVGEDDGIVTIICGRDISEEEADELVSSLQSKYPDLEIETLYGGQPLYHYLISVE